MIRVNLLKIKEKKRLKAIHAEIIVFLIAISIIGAGYFILNNNMNDKITMLNHEANKLQRELRNLQKIQKQVNAFKKKKEELQKKINIVKSLKKGQKGYYNLLITLEYALPEDIWISNFKFSGKQLQLNGASLRTSSVNKFIVNLYNTKMFNNIELKTVKKKTVDNIDINNFSITANIVLGG
jgi:type IV pilus assembly protein PilN